MTIKLKPEMQARVTASIKRFFAENMDDEVGDLKASLLLDFVLREIGPSIYNQAVADAQARIQDAVIDLDGSCYEADLGYWNESERGRK
jgi:uncharacterized protein (DUF2164 family)